MKQQAKTLPERRLLVRAGRALLTLDLTQIREISGDPGPDALLLAQVLELPLLGPGAAVLVVETGSAPVRVAVDGVGGVVEAAPVDVLKLPSTALLRMPGLVRAVLRVPEPPAWRGSSLLPTPVEVLASVNVVDAPTEKRMGLAADLEPVAFARLLLAAQAEK
ncbi:MAG: hypothetical protein AB2A00_22270 [Myxococcota bacterium]